MKFLRLTYAFISKAENFKMYRCLQLGSFALASCSYLYFCVNVSVNMFLYELEQL